MSAFKLPPYLARLMYIVKEYRLIYTVGHTETTGINSFALNGRMRRSFTYSFCVYRTRFVNLATRVPFAIIIQLN